MAFFSRIRAFRIIEDHVSELVGFEKQKAEAILEVYRRIRKGLGRRLSVWSKRDLRERFTAQKARGLVAQVEEALRAFRDNVGPEVGKASGEAMRLSFDQLFKEIEFFEEKFQGGVIPINLEALSYAMDQPNFLVEQYQVSIDRWSGETRTRIGDSIREGIAAEKTSQEILTGLMDNFEGYEWQLRRIVRTELHSIYNKSKIDGLKEQRKAEPTMKKALYHPMDSRTADDSLYLKDMNPIIPLEEPFRYVWQPPDSNKQYFREFMAPPDRPNDRAVLIPYSDKWQ